MLTIITPVLNGKKFIEKNILSIKQLNIIHEHIIIDGGSTDGTLEVIKNYNHIVLYKQDHIYPGMYGALHQGILMSKGELIACINCDDYILPKEFTLMFEVINSSNYDFIYTDSLMFIQKNNVFLKSKSVPFPTFFLKNGIMPFLQPSSIFTKSLYFKTAGYQYDKYRIIGDLALYIQFSKIFDVRFKRLPIYTTCFLVREDSLGNTNSDLVKIEKLQNQITLPNLFTRFIYKALVNLC